jgi:hypothetical protein
MNISRTPVQNAVPLCYSMHRLNDAQCKVCSYELGCVNNTQQVNQRQTLRQAAEDALAKHRIGLWDSSVSNIELLDLLIELWDKAGGSERPLWRRQIKWRDTMDRVLHSCKTGGWNPKTFIKAQFATVGVYCIKNGFRLVPAMITGESALMRFQSWARTNQRRYNDAHRNVDLDPEFESLMFAESLFGDIFMRSPDRTVSDIEEQVFMRHRNWTLSLTDQMPAIRLTAMSGACSSIYALAPSHILIPEERFSWHDLRKVVLDTFASEEEDDGKLLTLDARLGELL